MVQHNCTPASGFVVGIYITLRYQLPGPGIFPSANGWHTLFVVSPEKPTAPYHDFYLPLTQGDVKAPLSLNIPLETAGPLYLHTFPAIFEYTDAPSLATNDGDYQLNTSSLDRFLQFFQSHPPPNPPRPTGGTDEAESSWETFSGAQKFESALPERGMRFEIAPFAPHILGTPPSIWDELILCEQIQKDYSWDRVSNTISWLEELRKAPSSSLRPWTPYAEAYDGNLPVLQSPSLVSLYSTLIPIDGEPDIPLDESDTDPDLNWDDDPTPLYASDPVHPSSTIVPSAAPSAVVLDICDVLFNRSKAARAAISELRLQVDVEKGVSRLAELSALIFRSDGSSHSDTIRQALHTLCAEMKVTPSDGDFERAVDRILRPELDVNSADCLAALEASGLLVVGYITTDKVTFEEYLQPSLKSLLSTLTVLSPPSNPSGLFSSCSSHLQNAIAHIKNTSPKLTLEQILVVSTSSVRSLEPATALGMATALLLLQDDLEVKCAPEIYTSPSTMVLSSLSELPAVALDPLRWVPSTVYPNDPSSVNVRLCDIYQLDVKFSEGSTSVYRAVNWISNEVVVVKIALPEPSLSILPYEAKIYEQLAGHRIPCVRWVGRYTSGRYYKGEADVLVMDYLGPTLDFLRRACRGSLSLKSVLMIGLQILDFIEFAHSRGIIVRDIKPQNFAVGRAVDEASIIYAFDFGLAKMYVDPTTGTHIPLRTGRIPFGTLRYGSHWTHEGLDASRRDDIVVLGHVLLELFHGSLPWQGIYAPSPDAKVDRIREMKTPGNSILSDFLARSPKVLSDLVVYAWDLEFSQKPDYAMLRSSMEAELEERYGGYDGVFDWMIPKGTLLPAEYEFIVKPGSVPSSQRPL